MKGERITVHLLILVGKAPARRRAPRYGPLSRRSSRRPDPGPVVVSLEPNANFLRHGDAAASPLPLLFDRGDGAGADGVTAFADGEPHPVFDGDRGDQLHPSRRCHRASPFGALGRAMLPVTSVVRM